MVARAKGYNCYIVMPGDIMYSSMVSVFICCPDDQALEKYAILESLGAIVEKVRPCSIVDSNHFVNVAKRRSEEMNARGSTTKGFFCNQFESQANYMVDSFVFYVIILSRLIRCITRRQDLRFMNNWMARLTPSSWEQVKFNSNFDDIQFIFT